MSSDLFEKTENKVIIHTEDEHGRMHSESAHCIEFKDWD